MEKMNCPICGLRHDNDVVKCSSCGVDFSKIFERIIRNSQHLIIADFWWREPRGLKDPASRFRKYWFLALLIIPAYAWYMVQIKTTINLDIMTFLLMAAMLILFGFVFLRIIDSPLFICLTTTDLIRFRYANSRYEESEKWSYDNICECLIIREKKDKYYLKVVKTDGTFNMIGIPPKFEPIDLMAQLSSHGILCKDYTQQSAGPA